jgi:hypothetical protein
MAHRPKLTEGGKSWRQSGRLTLEKAVKNTGGQTGKNHAKSG